MLKIKLIRNLRKSIKQGHPWLYRNSIESVESINKPELCKIVDQKNNILAWGYYDPYSVIAVRILSVSAKPPGKDLYKQRVEDCCILRENFFDFKRTNAYRLINGEGDRLPGLVCDVYNEVAVLQTDGKGPYEFWDLDYIAKIILELKIVKSVYHKPRGKEEKSKGTWGQSLTSEASISVLENNINFNVDIFTGQKTGFFLDQRDNREYLQSWVKNKKVANLFSYTGGFSIYAGMGGAEAVTSVDISPKAIDLCNQNWESNNLKPIHKGVCADVFEYINSQLPGSFDIVVVDPPSMAHSEKQKSIAMTKYTELFASSAELVAPGGDLFLSSCSSHINFENFYEIAMNSLSKARKTAQVLRYSSQGADHPFLHICPEQRYLKFLHLKLN